MKIGDEVICKKLNNLKAKIVEITNYSFYKIPNIKIYDRNFNLVLVTDFEVTQAVP